MGKGERSFGGRSDMTLKKFNNSTNFVDLPNFLSFWRSKAIIASVSQQTQIPSAVNGQDKLHRLILCR